MRYRLAILSLLPMALYAPSVMAQQVPNQTLPETIITASRLADTLVGASVTVIDREEIERATAQTLPDILKQVPGIQVRNTGGNPLSSKARVDMRGFGSASGNNPLISVNGRRMATPDLAGFDFWATIPKESVERIEVIHGSAGGVLYGEGAIGGTINIITRDGAGTPITTLAEVAIGSNGQQEFLAQISGSKDNVSGRLTAQSIETDGWRDNGYVRELVASGNLRYNGEGQDYYLDFSASREDVGLPGARTKAQLISDPKGASTPNDYADTNNYFITLGGAWELNPSLDLIIDGGFRYKDADSSFGGKAVNLTNTTLSTWSFTPRIEWNLPISGMDSHTIGGVDFYYDDYDVEQKVGGSRTVAIDQTNLALYAQQSLSLTKSTDLSYGVRGQYTDMSMESASTFGGVELDEKEWNYALHLGVEHRINSALAIFARVGRNFRAPNVDERNFTPTSDGVLKTQTSTDLELGAKTHLGPVSFGISTYYMALDDEIQYYPDHTGNPFTGSNRNLDPTERYGLEANAGWDVLDSLRFRGGLAWTEATFREGIYKGKDIPLVSPWTASLGASWDIWQKYVTLDADLTYADESYLDADFNNEYSDRVPDRVIVDLQLGGQVKSIKWSAGIYNLFDEEYSTYGSEFGGGVTYYPEAGRTYMGRLGFQF